jgi:tetratricopeptide (TPR) repeat protein
LGLSQILSPRIYTAPATAVPYYAVSSKRYTNERKEEAGFPYADGGIQVTASDVYKFALAILENKLLREQTRSTMLTAYSKAGRGSYGYGWMINEDYGKKFFGHTGGTLAFSSGLRMDLEDGYIVVMVSNIPTNSTWMLNSLMSILYTGRNGWPAKKPLANIIFEIMDEKGLAYLKQNLDTIMKKGAYPPFRNAGPFIPASEMLTKFKMYDKAIELLEYISARFPQDWGPYNSMGDTYKAMGEKTKAKQSFEKALALNPKDEYAASQLKQL